MGSSYPSICPRVLLRKHLMFGMECLRYNKSFQGNLIFAYFSLP